MLARIQLGKLPSVRLITGLALALLMMAGSAAPAGAGGSDQGGDHSRLFATGNTGTQLLAIDVQTGTTTLVGYTGKPGCLPLAITPDGEAAYTVALSQDPLAQLAKIDLATGAATLIGSPAALGGLRIMGMTFSPDGVLYAAGNFDLKSSTFDSLYTIDLSSGSAARVASLGGLTKSDFIMSFAWDSDGNLFGASMMSLYRIDLSKTTNAATKVVDFVGSSKVMGIAIGKDDRFYAADFVGAPAMSTIYRLDAETGVLTPLFNTGTPFVHNIAFEVGVDD